MPSLERERAEPLAKTQGDQCTMTYLPMYLGRRYQPVYLNKAVVEPAVIYQLLK